jgi:hypothetical protein
MMTTTMEVPRTEPLQLSLARLHAMRGGYLLMAAGLMLVKWPRLPDAHTMPVYEGVTWCLLTAMSLLAFVGLRHPVAMLPVLVFESLWKVLWFGVVALPQALGGGLDQGVADMVARNALVVVIIAVVPWRYVGDRLVRAPGDRWR